MIIIEWLCAGGVGKGWVEGQGWGRLVLAVGNVRGFSVTIVYILTPFKEEDLVRPAA